MAIDEVEQQPIPNVLLWDRGEEPFDLFFRYVPYARGARRGDISLFRHEAGEFDGFQHFGDSGRGSAGVSPVWPNVAPSARGLGVIAVLLALVCAGLTGCTGEQAGGAVPAAAAGAVPQAVMEHGVLLLHGSIPAQLTVSANEGGDYEVTPAARSNGVEASYAVTWRGVDWTTDGRAEDVSGSFTALKLASGAWQLFAGAGDVVNTLCTSEGAFSTHGEDISGVYVGATERGDYRDIRLELQRNGATHTGTLRYTNPWGEVQTFRVLGFHRIAAEDVAVRHMDGQMEFWTHEGGSVRRRPAAAPAKTVEMRNGAISLGWLPPQQSVAVTLQRRGG